MPAELDVAIIGAGPYGLSICAHMRELGVKYRVFGNPMQSWIKEMPEGMHLKSEGFASNIYDPNSKFTLKRFCNAQGLPYEDLGLPVPLDTFVSFGIAFQRELVPEVERKGTGFSGTPGDRFQLKFDDGELVTARRVVVAVGISNFRNIPPVFSHLPSRVVSHSAQYGELKHFSKRRVFVIGGGASAIDIAGLLGELGTDVHLFVRKPEIEIHSELELPRPMGQRIRHPMSGIGPGWRSLFYCDAPQIYYYLPENIRVRQVKRHPPPAAGWFMGKYIKNISLHTGSQPESAQTSGDGVRVQFIKNDGSKEQLDCDHIISATGYKVDLSRLPFLDSPTSFPNKIS